MSLNYRMDNRTKEEFMEDIMQFTEVERFLGNALRSDFDERGMGCVQHEYGVDNSGSLIRGDLANFNPDKIFEFKDGSYQKIEIKSLPEYCTNFFTFKVSALKGCIHHNAKILVARRKDYFMIFPQAQKWMLDNLKARTDYKGWGGKLCVRIFMEEVSELTDRGLILKNGWRPEAYKYVEEHAEIIFAERRTRALQYIKA